MSSYSGVITLDLHAVGEKRLNVNAANRLWLPKFVRLGTEVFENPTDCIVSIRFDQSGSDGDVWAIRDGFRTSESGPFTHLFYTVLTRGINDRLCLMSGSNVSGGYANADGLSPSIGGPETRGPVVPLL